MTTALSTTRPSGPLGNPRGIGFAILIFIVTIGLYSLYWVFKTQEEVKEHSGIGVGGVLGLVIWILVNPVSWFVKIQGALNRYWESKAGETPAAAPVSA